jgi:hypothetical protein
VLAGRAWEEVDPGVLRTYAALAGTAPDAALPRLRRLGPGGLADSCRRALDAGAVSLPGLWADSGVRPLQTAVAGLDPALRERLSLLFGEPPMAKSLRGLVKRPAIADAYALDLAGRRVRAAIGNLADQDDPVIARGLADRASSELLCALTVMVTCRAPRIELTTVVAPGKMAVPGYPATALDDKSGPWPGAVHDAAELGADTSVFFDAVGEHGLRVPTSWVAGSGWTALWVRAHR